jgi:hypothetical protein
MAEEPLRQRALSALCADSRVAALFMVSAMVTVLNSDCGLR